VPVTLDAVRFNATVSFVNKSNKTALAETSNVASDIRAALKANAVATKDIKSTNVTVYPEYTWTQEKVSLITGYRASQTFDVLIRKADTTGTVVEAVVSAGSDSVQIGGISPVVLDNAVATEEARTSAVMNAKAKATSYAKLLGTSIGRVITMEETTAPIYQPPFMMDKATGMQSSTPLVVDLGTQDVTVTITIRWQLN